MIPLSVRSLFMKMNMCSPGMIYMVRYVWNIICLSEDVVFLLFLDLCRQMTSWLEFVVSGELLR